MGIAQWPYRKVNSRKVANLLFNFLDFISSGSIFAKTEATTNRIAKLAAPIQSGDRLSAIAA